MEKEATSIFNPNRHLGLKHKPKADRNWRQKLAYKKWYAKHREQKRREVAAKRALLDSDKVDGIGKVFHSEQENTFVRPKIYHTDSRNYRKFRTKGLEL